MKKLTLGFLQVLNIQLAIEGRQQITHCDTIFYTFSNMRPITYRLKFALKCMREVGLHAILVDNYLKKKIPLSIANSSFIEFTVDTNSESYENRFMVLFERVSTIEYSATKNKLFKNGSFVVTPNPTENNTIIIQFSNQSIGKYKIHLINNTGQIVFNSGIKVTETNGKVSIKPGINVSGSYQLVIIAEDGRKSVQQVIIK